MKQSFLLSNYPRWIVPSAGVALFLLLSWNYGARQGLLWVIGIAYGIFLTAPRFGFTTGWRVFVLHGDSKGINAQLLLVAVLTILSSVLLTQFPHFQSADAPITWSLCIGAFVFGWFMQLAEGCGSGTLCKATNLKTHNIIILLAFIIGSFAATLHLQQWVELGQISVAINLLGLFSQPIYIGVQLAIIAAIWLLVRSVANKKTPKTTWNGNRIYIFAILLAIAAAVNLLAVGKPWGIVYGIGLWGAKAFNWIGFDVASNGFWQHGYNNYALNHSLLLDNTSMTNMGLLFGAFMVRMFPSKQTDVLSTTITKGYWLLLLKSLAVGFVLGYSARLAFGCNIGALGGITTGSLHGWVWVIFAFTGSYICLRLREARTHEKTA